MEVFLEGIDDQFTQRVGAISLAVIALAIAFFVFVYDRIEWGRHVRIRVYFHHAGALHEGGAFVVAGKTVGEIESIALSPRGAASPLNGDEGVVVTVAIAAKAAARFDRAGDVFVASRGALSERYLELGPPDEKLAGTMLHEGDQLLGRDPPSLDRVLQRTWDNLTMFAAFRDEVRPEFEALRTQVGVLRAHLDPASATAIAHADAIAPMFIELSGLTDEIRTLRERSLGGEIGMEHLSAVIARVQTTVAATRVDLAKLDANATALRAGVEALRAKLGVQGAAAIAAIELAIDRVRADIEKVDPLLAQIDALNKSLARGDGSIMKLMRDPEFPEDAKELGKIMKRQPWKIIDRPATK